MDAAPVTWSLSNSVHSVEPPMATSMKPAPEYPLAKLKHPSGAIVLFRLWVIPAPEKLPDPVKVPTLVKVPEPVVVNEPFWVSVPATLMLPTLIRMSPLLVIVPLIRQPVMTFQSAPARFCTSSSKKTFILALPPRLSPLRFAVPAFTISTLEVEVRPDTFIVPFCSLVMVMPETLVRVEKVKPRLAQSIVPVLLTLLSILTGFWNSNVPAFVMPPVPASVPLLAFSDPLASILRVIKFAVLLLRITS